VRLVHTLANAPSHKISCRKNRLVNIFLNTHIRRCVGCDWITAGVEHNGDSCAVHTLRAGVAKSVRHSSLHAFCVWLVIEARLKLLCCRCRDRGREAQCSTYSQTKQCFVHVVHSCSARAKRTLFCERTFLYFDYSSNCEFSTNPRTTLLTQIHRTLLHSRPSYSASEKRLCFTPWHFFYFASWYLRTRWTHLRHSCVIRSGFAAVF